MRKTTGLSLLLLIFLSLSLIIFSLLSLSGATADETLSQKTADRTKEYYAAVSEANQILAKIDGLLAEQLLLTEHADIPASGTSPSSDLSSEANTEIDKSELYLSNCSQALQELFPEYVTTDTDSLYLTFSVPVTDDQILSITASVTYPFLLDDTLYQITEWKIMNTDDWTPDLSQKVYVPETVTSE